MYLCEHTFSDSKRGNKLVNNERLEEHIAITNGKLIENANYRRLVRNDTHMATSKKK